MSITAEQVPFTELMGAFVYAAEHGPLTAVAAFIHTYPHAVNQEHDDWTALRAAAVGGQTEIAAFLIDHGADIQLTNSHGNTALYHAAWAGHIDVVRLLLDAGAKTEPVNKDGNTAAIIAEAWKHVEIVTLIEQTDISREVALQTEAATMQIEKAKNSCAHGFKLKKSSK